MSTFVLRPPAEVVDRVQIVSFFITARLAAQDNREAFIQALLEQLASLLDQSLPPVLPEVSREAYLLGLLRQAADARQEAGQRLVLVVDGLDEDRSVTTGPDAHSIAALLPAEPPAGMRVIVTGRPNPPVPDDVPSGHPLLDRGIIRALRPSPYARDLKRMARRELQRLLNGTAAEREVLGFLTAARGGLAARDLAELTGAPLWEVEAILHTAVGRSFARRASTWDPSTFPDTYLLGHEELQVTAANYLRNYLDGYRHRLHTWASSHRARRWPADTPEYLFAGYYSLIASLGDLPRMIECATDIARHDRMLDLTGGDTAALNEIRVTLDLNAAQRDPDLPSALALAFHRDQLTDRNRKIPIDLPATWVVLGRTVRAKALALSITDPAQRALALARVAWALAASGQLEQAVVVAEQAKTAAQSIGHGVESDSMRFDPARLLADGGNFRDARAMLNAIPRAAQRAITLAQLIQALAASAQPDQAAPATGQSETTHRLSIVLGKQWAYPPADAYRRELQESGARGRLVEAETLVAAGHAAEAMSVANSIGDSSDRALALARVAWALATAGQPDSAAAAARAAEATARSVKQEDAHWSEEYGAYEEDLEMVAETLAAAGQYDPAESVAQMIPTREILAGVLTSIARCLAHAGLRDRATTVAQQAETVARSFGSTSDLERSDLELVIDDLAAAGQLAEAKAVARAVADPSGRLRRLAEALEEAGSPRRTEAHRPDPGTSKNRSASAGTPSHTIRSGQVRARPSPDLGPPASAKNLPWAAAELARAGQPDEAEVLARSITKAPFDQAISLAWVAGARAKAGHTDRAAALATEAIILARSISDISMQARALSGLARVLTMAGDAESAIRAAAVACSVARWVNVAKSVVRLSPTAFIRVRQMLESDAA